MAPHAKLGRSSVRNKLRIHIKPVSHLLRHVGEQGLSKMARNHIHLAQGVPGSGVISGKLSQPTSASWPLN